jgi:hypothetical protein
MKAFLIAFALVVLSALWPPSRVLSFNLSLAPVEAVHETRAATGFHRVEISGQVNVV